MTRLESTLWRAWAVLLALLGFTIAWFGAGTAMGLLAAIVALGTARVFWRYPESELAKEARL